MNKSKFVCFYFLFFYFLPAFNFFIGTRVTFLLILLVLASACRNNEIATWCWLSLDLSSVNGFTSKAPLLKPLATWCKKILLISYQHCKLYKYVTKQTNYQDNCFSYKQMHIRSESCSSRHLIYTEHITTTYELPLLKLSRLLQKYRRQDGVELYIAAILTQEWEYSKL